MEPKRPAPEPEQIEVDRSKYETVTDEAALDRWIAEATAQGYVAIDTETDCIDCIIAKLAGVSLATAPNRACYIPVGHSGADLALRRARASCRWTWCSQKLKPLLEDPAVLKIGHNLKYDWVMFDKAGIGVAPVDDTMVMSFDLDAGRASATGSTSSRSCTSTTSASPSSSCAGRARSRSPSTRCRSGRRPNMRPRMRTSPCACGCG